MKIVPPKIYLKWSNENLHGRRRKRKWIIKIKSKRQLEKWQGGTKNDNKRDMRINEKYGKTTKEKDEKDILSLSLSLSARVIKGDNDIITSHSGHFLSPGSSVNSRKNVSTSIKLPLTLGPYHLPPCKMCTYRMSLNPLDFLPTFSSP